ncbi:glycerate kinase family protein [Cytobacillus purgationiresistens]|uniref:Glycerate kinase n=1 Tax=Cytobacillus purgationiresistens TaxID=863449 RepID=A0ABU0AHX3_9BACI|nr:glycerate kinase [Cytobacillus purgationiresistens]MDQ0270850.1 glycerate kinase [Cytobacillus purgationiresistens]
MKIVIVPSGFKECLDSEDVALAMARGVMRIGDYTDIEIVPMIDGGEGFAKKIIKLKGGELIYKEVTGPVGKKIESYFGMFIENNTRTAVIEMAAAAGLKLVPLELRNPLKTTTFGVGELIIAALNCGVDRILIGCGDSGTSDGGAGMAQALGIRFFDCEHRIVDINGGEDLLKVNYIEDSQLDKRLTTVKIDVACNWHNVLCGKKGVANVFGPQKGAKPEQVKRLSFALEHYAKLISESLSIDVRFMPGSGASGGLGAGLIAFTGAILHPRFDIIKDYIQMEEKIAGADVVITAEGSLDFQTPNGKIPSEVARIAKQYHIPVIAITGTIGEGAASNYAAGIDAFLSIIQKPVSLEESMLLASSWIEESTESVIRQVAIGLKIANRRNFNKGILQK